MALHVRQQLVAAVKTAVTGLTTTGANVFGYNPNPLQAREMPGLCVWSLSDAAEAETIHWPPLYERAIELHVVGFAASNSDIDATLDLIAKEVETALGSPLTLGSQSVQLLYQGCEKDFGAGETQAGSIDIRYSASLASAANAPDVLS